MKKRTTNPVKAPSKPPRRVPGGAPNSPSGRSARLTKPR